MNKSLLLKRNIYNLAQKGIWDIDYAEYIATDWNVRGTLTANDYEELITDLEALRPVEVVEEITEE